MNRIKPQEDTSRGAPMPSARSNRWYWSKQLERLKRKMSKAAAAARW